MRPSYEDSTSFLANFNATRGGFNDLDYRNLEYLLLKFGHSPMTLLEIGSWTGMSSTLLCYYTKIFSGKLYCLDDFSGAGGLTNKSDISTKTILTTHFIHYNLYDYVEIIESNSQDLKNMFNHTLFDIILIDGNHELPFIREDIMNSLERLKDNGVLIGHDYNHEYVHETVDSLLPERKILNSFWYYEKTSRK